MAGGELEGAEKKPWRTILTSFGFLACGFLLLVMSVTYFSHHWSGAWALTLLAAILLIPGLYSSFVVIGTLRRWRGYSWHQIPSYEALN